MKIKRNMVQKHQAKVVIKTVCWNGIAHCLLPLSKDNRKHKQVTCLLTAQMLLLPACTVTKSQAWAAASHTYTYPSNTPLKNKTLDSDPGHLTAINPILCQR